MNCAYKEIYLRDATCNLGEMLEYAHEACSVNPDKALGYFIVSGYADRFSKGDPAVVCGMSGTELYRYAVEKCCVTVNVWPAPLVRYETEEYYWMGYMLALLQWKSGYSFGEILSKIKEEDFLRMYPALHTVSDENAVDTILDLYKSRSQYGRLQEYRKRIGMTQSQLAKASGVNLRSLQQYEAGTKSIKKAAAETVISLANVLGCKPEEIMV